MLEQICANFAWESDEAAAAAAVASHIKRFWTPLMRQTVCAAVASGEASPSPLATRVVALIG